MKKNSFVKLAYLFIICYFILFQSMEIYGQKNNLPKYAPGGLIVKFTSNSFNDKSFNIKSENGVLTTGISSVDLLNSEYKVKYSKPFYHTLYNPVDDKKQGKDRMFVFQFTNNLDMEKIAELYAKDTNIEYAYPNYLYYINATPNDSYYNDQWALTKINASSAWDITQGSSSVEIGIIDTGVDLDHPDLQSKLVSSSYWRDEVDIDTTAYKNDGYTLYSYEDYVTPDNDPQDKKGHGTHVAGIAAAATNNSTGIAGLGWNCKIIPLRAGCKIFLYQETSLFEADDWGRILKVKYYFSCKIENG